MGYIDISFGLSLNDTLWIVPEKKSDLKWEEVNLYKNSFSERLQMASFGLGYEGNSPYKISPEFTTNGMLKKCWIRENNKIFLLKSNSETGFDFASKHVEVFSEYYTSQIAKLFKPNSITYDIVEFNGELCSKCQIFTTENRGYLPITAFLTEEELKKAPVINDVSKCVLCGMCLRGCVGGALDIDRKRRTWTIDPAACVQCGVCVEHCPKQCLSLNEAYTFTADGDSPEPVSFHLPDRKRPSPGKPAVKPDA